VLMTLRRIGGMTRLSLLNLWRNLPPYSKSLFGKVHTSLAIRLSIRRIIANSMNVSLVCTFRS
jgi:hypothetical protein